MDATVHAARRARLGAAMGSTPVVLTAGVRQSRNYPAQHLPFRASSHFLYFAGKPIPGAALLIDDGEATLFVEPAAPDDALWIGETASPAELAAELGCAVRPIGELARALGGRPFATIASPNADGREQQRRLLGRDTATADDERLADAIIAIRLVHDEAAVDGLRRAAEATAAAHRAGMAATRPGLREHHVRAAMEAALVARGMTTSYGSIVTVHGEVLHNEDHHHALADGDLLLCDVGAETPDGWAGDVTRTWPVSGRFSPTQRAMYEVVLAAQKATIAAVRPGVRYRDLHLSASRHLAQGLVDLGVLRGDPDELVADGVHALLFPHGVGHLLGLDVHDMEDLGDRAGYAPGRTRSPQFGLCYLRLDRDLLPGMAVTIEPGLYLVPAILRDEKLRRLAGDRLVDRALGRFADVRGIRIEDDVLVTSEGAEVLTRAIPKEPAEVERSIGAAGAPA